MIVLAIMMIASGIFFMSLQPALKDTRVTNAYNTTLMTLRRAREAAIAERRTYMVTFNNAVTPNIDHYDASRHRRGDHNPDFAADIFFRVEPGIPTTAATTPGSLWHRQHRH